MGMLAPFAHSTALASHSNAAVAVENLNIHRAFIGLTIIIIFKNELAHTGVNSASRFLPA